MKKSGQILNSPVVSIQEGREVGMVKELIVNPEKKSVEFLMVENQPAMEPGSQLAIPFRETVGVGDYAVTIQHRQVMLDLGKMNIAGNLLENRVHLIDEKVISRTGELLGTVQEYLVNPENGQIAILQVVTEGEQAEREISFESIISMGEQLVVVSEDAGNQTQGPVHTPEPVVEGEPASASGTEAEVLLDQMTATESGSDSSGEAEQGDESGSSVEMFIERQKSYLLDKELKQDLQDAQGNVIARAGTRITPEVFEQVQTMGRQKVIELTMLTD